MPAAYPLAAACTDVLQTYLFITNCIHDPPATACLQAMYRATLGRWLAGAITFKVTAKGLQRIADLPIR